MVPKSLRNTFLGYKTGKIFKRLTSQSGQERNCKFSKANALRKGKSGTCRQNEACLQLGQAEGNMNALWVPPHKNPRSSHTLTCTAKSGVGGNPRLPLLQGCRKRCPNISCLGSVKQGQNKEPRGERTFIPT